MRFKDKVIMITGGAQGIGAAAARAFAAEGAAAAIADVDLPRAEALVSELAAGGGRALALRCDVADPASTVEAAAQIAGELGGIDLLINGAALHNFTYGQPTLELGIDKWRAMLDVNVLGIVNCVAAVRTAMAARGGGVIVNMSSINSFVNLSAYGVSKLAVRGLTVAMAAELAPESIRVLGIAPGMMDTESTLAELPEMHKRALIDRLQLIKRQGRREDVVNAMLFFCSDEASFVTGETLIVGGGYPLRI